MKKKLMVTGLTFALAIGAVQSASAKLFLGCGTNEYASGACVGGWQPTMVQAYIFGFEFGDAVQGAGQAC